MIAGLRRPCIRVPRYHCTDRRDAAGIGEGQVAESPRVKHQAQTRASNRTGRKAANTQKAAAFAAAMEIPAARPERLAEIPTAATPTPHTIRRRGVWAGHAS